VADRDRVVHSCRPFSHVRLLINALTHMHLWFMHVPVRVSCAGELAECVVGCAVPDGGPAAIERRRRGRRRGAFTSG
jgi:hypothetical protein